MPREHSTKRSILNDLWGVLVGEQCGVIIKLTETIVLNLSLPLREKTKKISKLVEIDKITSSPFTGSGWVGGTVTS